MKKCRYCGILFEELLRFCPNCNKTEDNKSNPSFSDIVNNNRGFGEWVKDIKS